MKSASRKYLRSYCSLTTDKSTDPAVTRRSKCRFKFQAMLTLRHSVISVADESCQVEVQLRANRSIDNLSICNKSLTDNNLVFLIQVTSNHPDVSPVDVATAPEDFHRRGQLIHGSNLKPNVDYVIRYSLKAIGSMRYFDRIDIVGDQIRPHKSSVSVTLVKAARPNLDLEDGMSIDSKDFGNRLELNGNSGIRVTLDHWIQKPRSDQTYVQFELGYSSPWLRLCGIYGITGDGSRILLAEPDSLQSRSVIKAPVGREFDRRISLSKEREGFVFRKVLLVTRGTTPDFLPRRTKGPSRALLEINRKLIHRIRESKGTSRGRGIPAPFRGGDLSGLMENLGGIVRALSNYRGTHPNRALLLNLRNFYDSAVNCDSLVLIDPDHRVATRVETDSVIVGYGLLNAQRKVTEFEEIFAHSAEGALPLNYLMDPKQEVAPFAAGFRSLLEFLGRAPVPVTST